VKIRRPCQAGAFYEGDAESLKRQIKNCFLHKLGPGKLPEVAKIGSRNIIGLVCPHAGYMFSGYVAAHAYYNLALDGKPDVAVIFGPNHTGYGSALAVMNEGFWRTPLGDVEVDTEIANGIMRESQIIDVDESAHRLEHSIEVQLPFLQYIYGSEFKIVPICFLMQDLHSAREVGQAVAKVLAEKNAVIIASSDMTHYEPHDIANEKDRQAIDAILELDEKLLLKRIEDFNISMCGFVPATVMLIACKELGAKMAELVKYQTSGDVIGDYSEVVGYAGMIVK